MRRLWVVVFLILFILSTELALADSWTCPNCGSEASLNFCSNCGKANPSAEWICPQCKNTATGNFCNNCGSKRPVESETVNTYNLDSQISQQEDGSETSVAIELNEEDELAASPDDFEYVNNGEAVQINGYKGKGGYVVIPNRIEGMPVTRIASKAFFNMDSITGIVLPRYLTFIGQSAFSGMDNLTGVIVIPELVEKVDHYAFMNTDFDGLVIDGNAKFGVNAFLSNRSLKFVYIKEGCSPTFDDSCISNNPSLSVVVLPMSMGKIGRNNFMQNVAKDFTLYCPKGSVGQQYAKDNFIVINTEDYDTVATQYASMK